MLMMNGEHLLPSERPYAWLGALHTLRVRLFRLHPGSANRAVVCDALLLLT